MSKKKKQKKLKALTKCARDAPDWGALRPVKASRSDHALRGN